MRYKYRVKMTYIISRLLLMFCKMIVYLFVADRSLCSLTYIKNTPNEDKYEYCHTKTVCPLSSPANYMLYIKKRGYMFKGDSILEVYMKAIYRHYGERAQLVFPAYPKLK